MITILFSPRTTTPERRRNPSGGDFREVEGDTGALGLHNPERVRMISFRGGQNSLKRRVKISAV